MSDDIRLSRSDDTYQDRSRRSSTIFSYVWRAPPAQHLDRQTSRSSYSDEKSDDAGGGLQCKLCVVVVVVVALMVVIAAGVGLGLGLGLTDDDGTLVQM